MPAWVAALNPAANAAWDFANDRYWRLGVAQDLATATDFTGGPGTNDNLAGVWSQFATDVVRRTDKGVIIEPTQLNSIRNNSMQGAAAGSPGTLPTNWAWGGATGLTRTVVAIGIVDGIDYIDIRLSGTTGSTAGDIQLDTTTQIVAANGETWIHAVYAALVGGTWTNVTFATIDIVERTAAGVFVVLGSGNNLKTLGPTLELRSLTRTLSGGGTVARVQPRLGLTWSSGVAIDLTLRIGWPSLLKADTLLSPIRTTSSAVSRAADALILKDAGGTYNLIVKFDNDSTQTISGQSGDYAVPTNLNRAVIKSIVAVAA